MVRLPLRTDWHRQLLSLASAALTLDTCRIAELDASACTTRLRSQQDAPEPSSASLAQSRSSACRTQRARQIAVSGAAASAVGRKGPGARGSSEARPGEHEAGTAACRAHNGLADESGHECQGRPAAGVSIGSPSGGATSTPRLKRHRLASLDAAHLSPPEAAAAAAAAPSTANIAEALDLAHAGAADTESPPTSQKRTHPVKKVAHASQGRRASVRSAWSAALEDSDGDDDSDGAPPCRAAVLASASPSLEPADDAAAPDDRAETGGLAARGGAGSFRASCRPRPSGAGAKLDSGADALPAPGARLAEEPSDVRTCAGAPGQALEQDAAPNTAAVSNQAASSAERDDASAHVGEAETSDSDEWSEGAHPGKYDRPRSADPAVRAARAQRRAAGELQAPLSEAIRNGEGAHRKAAGVSAGAGQAARPGSERHTAGDANGAASVARDSQNGAAVPGGEQKQPSPGGAAGGLKRSKPPAHPGQAAKAEPGSGGGSSQKRASFFAGGHQSIKAKGVQERSKAQTKAASQAQVALRPCCGRPSACSLGVKVARDALRRMACRHGRDPGQTGLELARQRQMTALCPELTRSPASWTTLRTTTSKRFGCGSQYDTHLPAQQQHPDVPSSRHQCGYARASAVHATARMGRCRTRMQRRTIWRHVYAISDLLPSWTASASVQAETPPPLPIRKARQTSGQATPPRRAHRPPNAAHAPVPRQRKQAADWVPPRHPSPDAQLPPPLDAQEVVALMQAHAGALPQCGVAPADPRRRRPATVPLHRPAAVDNLGLPIGAFSAPSPVAPARVSSGGADRHIDAALMNDMAIFLHAGRARAAAGADHMPVGQHALEATQPEAAGPSSQAGRPQPAAEAPGIRMPRDPAQLRAAAAPYAASVVTIREPEPAAGAQQARSGCFASQALAASQPQLGRFATCPPHRTAPAAELHAGAGRGSMKTDMCRPGKAGGPTNGSAAGSAHVATAPARVQDEAHQHAEAEGTALLPPGLHLPALPSPDPGAASISAPSAPTRPMLVAPFGCLTIPRDNAAPPPLSADTHGALATEPFPSVAAIPGLGPAKQTPTAIDKELPPGLAAVAPMDKSARLPASLEAPRSPALSAPSQRPQDSVEMLRGVTGAGVSMVAPAAEQPSKPCGANTMQPAAAPSQASPAGGQAHPQLAKAPSTSALQPPEGLSPKATDLQVRRQSNEHLEHAAPVARQIPVRTADTRQPSEQRVRPGSASGLQPRVSAAATAMQSATAMLLGTTRRHSSAAAVQSFAAAQPAPSSGHGQGVRASHTRVQDTPHPVPSPPASRLDSHGCEQARCSSCNAAECPACGGSPHTDL